jgi:hypothetical protein
MPFRTIDGRPFVRVFVNGHPASFLVDTGDSGSNAISRRFAIELHLKMRAAEAISGANAGSLSASHAVIDRFQFGPIVLRNSTFTVADFTPLERRIGFQLSGIIGAATLATHRIHIDGPRRRIDVDSLSPLRGVSLPLSIRGGWPIVQARVDGIDGTFLIDTGDRSYLTLFTPFARSHFPMKERRLRGVVTGFGLVAPIVTDLTRTRFALGTIRVPDLLTRLATQTKGGFASSALSGSIGYATLQSEDVELDYKHRRLIVAPSRNPPRSEWDHTGMWLSRGRIAIDVDDVIPRSPAAEAGLRPGDRLVSVDGRSAQSIDLPELRSRLASAQPRRLRMIVRRKDRTFIVVVRPRALI